MKRAVAAIVLLAATSAFADPLEDAKRLADDSIRLGLQLQAAAAGADGGEAHRAAEKKLQEALDVFRKSGDVESYHRAADLAGQARALFAEARATSPAAIPAPPPAPSPAPPAANHEPKFESAAVANARIAVQQYRRHLIEAGKPANDARRLEALIVPSATPETLQRIAEEAARSDRALGAVGKSAANVAPERAQIEAAFRAYAVGNLDGAEQLLATAQSASALALRGCVRAARGLLAKDGGALVDAALADFRAAKKLDPSLRLDPHFFSPKLVALFDRAQ